MASDGMFDNVYDEGVEACIKKRLEASDGPKLEDKKIWGTSKCIAQRAETYGKKRDFFSPFASHAKEHGKQYMGGKEDDIVVIVA